jgi:hypothetical protein
MDDGQSWTRWIPSLRTVPRLTATVTATSATVDSHRHTSTTVYLGTGTANRPVVTPEKRKVGGSTPPLPTTYTSKKWRLTCINEVGRFSVVSGCD